jgi:hypothetical protein
MKLQHLDTLIVRQVCNLLAYDEDDITEVTSTEQGWIIKGKRGFEVRVPVNGKQLPPTPPRYTSGGAIFPGTIAPSVITYNNEVKP